MGTPRRAALRRSARLVVASALTLGALTGGVVSQADAQATAVDAAPFPTSQNLSLGDDDARAAIRVPAEDRGVELSDGAVEAMIDRAHGYPYFLQEWGYHVWNAADKSPISRALVEQVTPRVISHLDSNFFRVRFDRLTPAERKYLRAMAELGPGPHRSGDIAAQLGVKVESVAPRRSALVAKGMVYSPAHGDTAFTVPLFDEFLLRALPKP
jgi:hypothetical protein